MQNQIQLLESILDDSNQMIQLSHLEDFTMVYANMPARIYTSHANMPYEGQHCYKYMMGLDEQCPFCPMRQMNGFDTSETEVDNGQQIFAVKTKIIDWNGQKAFIEYAWDITEIRRSEKIFETQMQNLIQSIPDANGIFHLDLTDDICISINGTAKKSLEQFPKGMTVDETVKFIGSFVPDEEGRKAFFRFFCRETLLSAYKNGNVELSHDTRSYFDDGHIGTAHIIARLVMNPATNHLECIIYGIDISDEIRQRKEYETYMQEQLAIFNALSRDFLNIFLIDAQRNTATILKLDGYVTSGIDKTKKSVYPYYATCLQYIRERVHPEDRTMMRSAMRPETILRELSNNPEYVRTYKTLINGKIHYYQFRYMRLEQGGHIIAGFQNIDAIITAERMQQEKLSQALAAAQKASRAKTIFLNNISHDIRTPLNAVMGFAALAVSQLQDAEKVRDYLSKIMISGNHLRALLNDVLDMSQIESGMLQVANKPLSLQELLTQLRAIVQTALEEKHLTLTFDTDCLVHSHVLADRLRLNQIFLNILDNSIKFTAAGGYIRFSVVEHDCPEPGYACYDFHIKDNGIGINVKFKPHIFEPFTREQSSTLSGIPGTGLGLSITKRIADLLGGQISVKSQPEKGTEFIFSIKLELCSPVEEKSSAPNFLPENNRFSGRHILLVEDNELNREIAAEILKMAGFTLDTAEDGTVAVKKMAAARPGEYDLILMDIQMPKMNGYEASRLIRKLPEPEISSIPIIAITANVFEEDKQRAMGANINGCIGKPLNIDKLMNMLERILP